MDDINLYYKIENPKNKKKGTLIFLHGFPEFHKQWKEQVIYFSNDYCCICPDLRGFNQSPKPQCIENYDINLIADDVKNLIEKLCDEKTYLVGHDWGGIVAWILAGKYPSLIKKLIILNAPHPACYEREIQTNSEQQKRAAYAVLFRQKIAHKLLARNNFSGLDQMFVNDLITKGIFDEKDRDNYHKAWSKDSASDSMLNYYRATKLEFDQNKNPIWQSFKLSDQLDSKSLKINVPTSIIWGEKDKALVKENLNEIEKYIDHFNIHYLPLNSHWLVHEDSQKINEFIKNAINNLG